MGMAVLLDVVKIKNILKNESTNGDEKILTVKKFFLIIIHLNYLLFFMEAESDGGKKNKKKNIMIK